jgi:integrase/recombinase XerD
MRMSSLNTIDTKTNDTITHKKVTYNDILNILEDFKEFCRVDRQSCNGTIRHHVMYIKNFLNSLDKPLDEITDSDIRAFLSKYTDGSPYTYANAVKAIRIFVRDYLKKKDIVESFKLPTIPFQFKKVPTKQELKTFYGKLRNPKEKALFLMYATNGLRKEELTSLRLEDIDFEKRMITPKARVSRTKHTWITFFNEEAYDALQEYLKTRRDELGPDSKVFLGAQHANMWRIFNRTSKETGIYIMPQVLREWFCSEMLSKGVQEVYVDAFCGRVPKSVLARHYTDFSPDRLKEIYDKAGLKVLS